MMQHSHPRNLLIKDYTYVLPDERIAKYPLAERDLSKLLVYKDGAIAEDIYRNVAAHIPQKSLLVFNDTRVIAARMFFNNANGAKIEVFCLEPAGNTEMAIAMAQTGSARWHCLIGKANKWKEKVLHLQQNELQLSAEIVERAADAFVVEFKWQPAELSFAAVLERTGAIPIPPYLKRQSDESDRQRYQTVYAHYKGSVAAPTAGLHFTPQILEQLKANEVKQAFVTLHVGAGTFKPVKSENIGEHEMHAEFIDVHVDAIQQLAAAYDAIISVGTTSLRTIESLYWMGVKLLLDSSLSIEALQIKQWEPYELEERLSGKMPSKAEALMALLETMQKRGVQRLISKTQIIIAPGYSLKVPDGLITNFHQPNSTLLLLVAAVAGDDWKKIYDYALSHNFRFLSYGDGSLIWKRA